MKIYINFDFQHIKPRLFQPTCQDWNCIYSACSHSLFMFICVHLIIALFKVRSCFWYGPFDDLQINFLKFGCFRCNGCLMDTCTQSARETSHPKQLDRRSFENELCRMSWWPSGSNFLLHLSPHFLGPSLVWHCKTTNPKPFVPILLHKTS